jgi:serine/threonine protein kinase
LYSSSFFHFFLLLLNRSIPLFAVVSHSDTRSDSRLPRWKRPLHLVFDMMDYDLTGLREAQKLFTLASVKHYMRQILIGIAHLHKERIIHRDLVLCPMGLSKL